MDRLVDGFGRVHDDLRVSVTDRCNLRCTYCMPEEPTWFPHDQVLTYEELGRLIGLFVERGVRKVRFTGGEPLLRRDLGRLIQIVADLPGVEDISLTTNGVRLAGMAPGLVEAGLHRVNVSLDTLDPKRFERLTRRARLGRVLEGLDAAVAAGLGPVKVNAVLIRGENDDEVERLAERARHEGWELRFIEVMPLDNDGRWKPERVVPGDEVRARLDERWPLEPVAAADPSAPAHRWRYLDGKGTVGFIDSVSAPFCGDCSRLRLTCDGGFRNCLYDNEELNLRDLLRSGADDETLIAAIQGHVLAKGRGGALDLLETKAAVKGNRTMHQIGG